MDIATLPARPVANVAPALAPAPPEHGPGPGAEADRTAPPRFADMLAALNPLQGLPVIGAIYRHLTGDVPHPAAQVVGGLIYGGPIGLMLGALTAAFEQTTGKTPIQVAMDAISPAQPGQGDLAQATPLLAGLADPDPQPAPAETQPAPPPPPPAIVAARAAAVAPPTPARPARAPQPERMAADPLPLTPSPARPAVTGARDLAFYQAHAGARLPAGAAQGAGAPLERAGFSPQRVQPHMAPASIESAPATPTAPLAPAAPAPESAPPTTGAARPRADAATTSDAPPGGTGQDFAARMLQGLERYRAMNRAAEMRAPTLAFSQ